MTQMATHSSTGGGRGGGRQYLELYYRIPFQRSFGDPAARPSCQYFQRIQSVRPPQVPVISKILLNSKNIQTVFLKYSIGLRAAAHGGGTCSAAVGGGGGGGGCQPCCSAEGTHYSPGQSLFSSARRGEDTCLTQSLSWRAPVEAQREEKVSQEDF